MPSKNNLSALKKPDPKPILPSNDKDQPAPLTGTKKVGRKPAPDKRSYKVLLSLTEGQGAKLEEKSGLAGGATVIYDHLLKTGFFD
ncbi:hypothetical protein [uncultured Roseibium sp.]|uniref:hypothetical protein n=1 Tax=uncultured Roseibium sp. TaxID=1936171 RepID=UPI0026366741|nr:hypothetical protein [uncultured Roseibium sp.]